MLSEKLAWHPSVSDPYLRTYLFNYFRKSLMEFDIAFTYEYLEF